jgi:hypothetical protein
VHLLFSCFPLCLISIFLTEGEEGGDEVGLVGEDIVVGLGGDDVACLISIFLEGGEDGGDAVGDDDEDISLELDGVSDRDAGEVGGDTGEEGPSRVSRRASRVGGWGL